MITNTHIILNVCLVPDIAKSSALSFVNDAVTFSHTLNQGHPSYYSLERAFHGEEFFDLHANNVRWEKRYVNPNSYASFPHVTITHVRVPNSLKAMTAIEAGLGSLLGQEIQVNVTDYKELMALQPFDRDALASGGISRRVPHDEKHDVRWFGVDKAPLIALQQDVRSAIGKAMTEATCLTGQGEKYKPHFTLSVVKAGTVIGEADLAATVEVPCRLMLANCGPFGQISCLSPHSAQFFGIHPH